MSLKDFFKPTLGKIAIGIPIAILAYFVYLIIVQTSVIPSLPRPPQHPPEPSTAFLRNYIWEPLLAILLLSPNTPLGRVPALLVIPLLVGYYYLLATLLYPLVTRVSRIPKKYMNTKQLAILLSVISVVGLTFGSLYFQDYRQDRTRSSLEPYCPQPTDPKTVSPQSSSDLFSFDLNVSTIRWYIHCLPEVNISKGSTTEFTMNLFAEDLAEPTVVLLEANWETFGGTQPAALPPGVVISFDPASVELSPDDRTSGVVRVTVDERADNVTYWIRIIARSEGFDQNERQFFLSIGQGSEVPIAAEGEPQLI